ncbi:hypothetical protein [Zoogloea dura]|jgi:hypothetical protein|uniref:Uncharacterized protein n=1 Tax=Zoogloea dura TaxID=2728840 RepID=A0A848G005_9RHOO|nr:hypothetical protein [Zoogloea dura]NML24350.1 hypothetical protein [Zoogloea dura]
MRITGLTALSTAVISLGTAFAQQAPDNAIRNADGTRTIPQSRQLPEANERHSRWCKNHGGVDITNDGNLTLESNTIDAVVCMRTDGSPGETGAFIPKGNTEGVIAPDANLEKAPAFTSDTTKLGPGN